MTSFNSRVLGAACVAALAAAPVQAQALPDTLSLAPLLAAVDHAPAVRATALSAQVLGARARGTGFRPDPQVEAMLWPGTLLGGGNGDRLMLRASQMLPYPSALRLERAAAEARAGAAHAEVAEVRLERYRAVQQAYYALYRAQQLDALIRTFQRRLGAFAEAAAVRYEVGRGTQGAILQAQLERDRLEEQRRALATMRHAALTTLAALVGRPALAAPADALVVVAMPPLPDLADSTLVANALARRSAFAVFDAEARAAEADVALARSAFRPEIGVSVALRFMGTDSDGLVASPGIGAMVRLPLNRDRLQARLDEAQLRQAEVAVRREGRAREVEAAIVQYAYTAQREAETLELYQRRLLPQAALTSEAILSTYTTGQASFLELLGTERTRFELSMAAEEARYRYLVAIAELERALGNGAQGDEALASPLESPRP